jgi:transcriptional regulator with XRE-family HTH domain
VTASSTRPYQEFGSWLRSRRLASRWTQEELARRLAYDVSYVRKIEWGERRPSDALRVRLGQVLGVPVSNLPGAAGTAPPAGVPLVQGPLIGRDEAVATVLGLFEGGSRLVTVVGAPGVGKTRLAVAVAPHVEDDVAVRVRFVPLLDVVDDADVGPAIGHALGLGAPPAGEDAATRLIEALRSEQTMLILDNFEHVMPAAGLVAELLAGAPALRVLVTSRQVLGLRLERHVQLPPLPVPAAGEDPDDLAAVPSVALFLSRARQARPEFVLDAGNAAEVAEICVRLQGIPMAIELAAASLRVLSPRALLAELGRPRPAGRRAP